MPHAISVADAFREKDEGVRLNPRKDPRVELATREGIAFPAECA